MTKKAIKKIGKKEQLALEHLIEETLSKAFKSKEEKISEFKKMAETKKPSPSVPLPEGEGRSLKIPGVRKADGSECCGGNCCEVQSASAHQPVLSKKQYFDLINSVIDPETGIGISDMGLIYDVEEFPSGLIEVTMTLTSMGCPAGGQITTEIDSWLRLQNHVKDVKINVVWEPAWKPDMMNPDIRAMMFGN